MNVLKIGMAHFSSPPLITKVIKQYFGEKKTLFVLSFFFIFMTFLLQSIDYKEET